MQGQINVFNNLEDAQDDASDGGELYHFADGLEIVGAPIFTGNTDDAVWIVIKGGEKIE